MNFIQHHKNLLTSFINYQYRNNNIQFYFFGDKNQTSPDRKTIQYDYDESKTINEWIPNRIELEYDTTSSRYNFESYIILKNFLKYNTIYNKTFKSIDLDLDTNLCYLNKTRIIVNTNYIKNYILKNNCKTILCNFHYNNSNESYPVFESMKLICIRTDRKYDIYNSMEYKLSSIDFEKEIFTINDIKYNIYNFTRTFIPNYCMTIHKAQGSTYLNKHYNLFDIDIINKRLFFTALSRTNDIMKYIHLDQTKMRKYYLNKKEKQFEVINSRFNIQFNNAKIYHIYFKNNEYHYIGSTINTLDERLNQHINNIKSAIYKYKDEIPIIELLLNVNANTNKKL